MKKRLCKVLAMAAVLSMLLNPMRSAAVAEEPRTVLDETKAVSLTICKYDMTRAIEDEVSPAGTITATGETQADVESLYADYAIEGVVYACYKVGDILSHSDQDAGDTSFRLLYGVSDLAMTALGLTEAEAETEVEGKYYYSSDCLAAALTELMSTEAKTIAGKNALETLVSGATAGAVMPATDQYGKTTLTDMEQGLYLVVETKVPEEISRTTMPFLLSLPMANFDSTGWLYDVTCYPKGYSDRPGLKKEVAEVVEGTAGTYADTVTASTGDTLAYQITSVVPEITSSATYLSKYTFEDVLPAGLAYREADKTSDEEDLISITWYDSDGAEVITWSESDSEPMFSVSIGESDNETPALTIEMTEAGLAEINGDDESAKAAGLTGYSGYTMVMDYRVTVDTDESVILGGLGNEDRVKLTWSRTGTDYEDSLTDSCRVYTYGLDITKVFGVEAEGADLTEVSFTIRNVTDDLDLYAVSDGDGVYYLTAGEDEGASGAGTSGSETSGSGSSGSGSSGSGASGSGTSGSGASGTVFHPDSDGTLLIYGLEDDIYEITETATSEGYNLLTNVIRVEISSTTDRMRPDTGDDMHHDEGEAGHCTRTASATVNDEAVTMESSGSSANALVPMTVVNTRGFDIPQTGESGAFLLPLIGLLGVAGLLAVAGRMKREGK